MAEKHSNRSNKHKICVLAKTFLKRYFGPAVAFELLIRNKTSYLHQTGWMESLKRGYPCKMDGTIIPWMNYPVVSFLERRLKDDLSLFEFGSGHSIYFYSRLVKKVVSIEHDETWFRRLGENIPENVELIYQAMDFDGAYCRAIHSTGQDYDIVIVDGRDRVNCMKQSLGALTPGGVVILDDSQREAYAKGIGYMVKKGFRAIDFEGLKATEHEIERTTIFYRKGNCLDI